MISKEFFTYAEQSYAPIRIYPGVLYLYQGNVVLPVEEDSNTKHLICLHPEPNSGNKVGQTIKTVRRDDTIQLMLLPPGYKLILEQE